MTTPSQRRDNSGASLFGGVPQVEWTPARVAELCRLSVAGVSARLIARALGHGLTRNAVLGKLWRLKMGGGSRQRGWPPSLVVKLRELWKAGATACSIAKALGRGVTRGAVLGKLFRLKMQRKYSRVDRLTPSMPRLKFMEARI